MPRFTCVLSFWCCLLSLTNRWGHLIFVLFFLTHPTQYFLYRFCPGWGRDLISFPITLWSFLCVSFSSLVKWFLRSWICICKLWLKPWSAFIIILLNSNSAVFPNLCECEQLNIPRCFVDQVWYLLFSQQVALWIYCLYIMMWVRGESTCVGLKFLLSWSRLYSGSVWPLLLSRQTTQF